MTKIDLLIMGMLRFRHLELAYSRYVVLLVALLILLSKVNTILDFMYLKQLYYDLFSPREDKWGKVFQKLKAKAHEQHMEKLRAERGNKNVKTSSEVDLAMIQTDTTIEFEMEGDAVYENFVWILDNEVIYNFDLLTLKEKKTAIRIHKNDIENYLNIEVI